LSFAVKCSNRAHTEKYSKYVSRKTNPKAFNSFILGRNVFSTKKNNNKAIMQIGKHLSAA
jgi:hypothetical protein